MPRQLRKMFIRILEHCQPLHPEKLWEEFEDAIAQDFARHLEMPQAHRKAYTYTSKYYAPIRRTMSG